MAWREYNKAYAMFRAIGLLMFFLLFTNVKAQDKHDVFQVKAKNQEMALEKLQEKEVSVKRSGIGNALLTFYQKVLSPVIAADCIYSPSCSRFSREAVNQKGLIRGIWLSADRLSRCNHLSSKDIPDYKFNEEGLAEDVPEK